jgi:hypothetical protein
VCLNNQRSFSRPRLISASERLNQIQVQPPHKIDDVSPQLAGRKRLGFKHIEPRGRKSLAKQHQAPGSVVTA